MGEISTYAKLDRVSRDTREAPIIENFRLADAFTIHAV